MIKYVLMKSKLNQVFKEHSNNMNKIKYMAGAVLAAMAISSCDDETLTIGNTLTNEGDRLTMTTGTLYATTRTVVADSVLSNTDDWYFGNVQDPETQAFVKCEFTTQFNILESMYISPEQYFVNKENGKVTADSCDIIIYTTSPYNSSDKLTAMQMRIRELNTMIDPTKRYYSNFNPDSYIRKDAGAIDLYHSFTFTNLTDDESVRNNSDYLNNIRISLNKPYTGKDGTTYKNYGTYILQQYMEHKEYFRNSYVFAKEVCPGFAFEVVDGTGLYVPITDVGLRIYYKLNRDSVFTASLALAGTEEVLQTQKVVNDMQVLQNLAKEDSHTYLKTPAGLFTEVTLPVEEIWNGHEGDSLLAAKLVFQRLNNEVTSDRTFGTPTALLLLPKDRLKSFFESKSLPDDKTSFYTTFTSANTYPFKNISTLISWMWKTRETDIATLLQNHPDWTREQALTQWANEKDENGNLKHENWNKVLLVPISYTASSSTSITKAGHNMSLTSTRLVGGKNNPIAVDVVYGKFAK